jgi:hypothetical protein
MTEEGDIIYIDPLGDTLVMSNRESDYTLEKFSVMPDGSEIGVKFDFNDPEFNGIIYYGFYPDDPNQKHEYPLYHSRGAVIDSGKAECDIKNRLAGKYDFINWQETGKIKLGYRIINGEGRILYDGKLRLTGKGPFEVDTSITEGPLLNLLTHESAVVYFKTNYPCIAKVIVNDREFSDENVAALHEISISGLEPDTIYDYTVVCAGYEETHTIQTAPKPGSQMPFTFAYASDGRGNAGGGERDIKGVNSYMLKKLAALSEYYDVRFFQFTGDLIDGYTTDPGEINLEYANWKRTIEPYAHSMPFVAGFGNHETLLHYFRGEKTGATVDKFPYETVSSEAIFAENFVNPLNGPESEDGSRYDPDPNTIDFPSYKENVFCYTYDNVAMISLNSNYWYSPSIKGVPHIGGNLHGYIMDNQLEWLKETLEILEKDNNIDHIFVTIHTPIFPNGGHVRDDMWYRGDNTPRPYIAGDPVEKGIIERRDQLLDLMMNHSTKVVASLTGDEHNYSLLRVHENLPIYPDGYTGKKLTKFRPFWHINNGAAGAPYYGREDTPWSDYVEEFSTQNALVLFHVHGKNIKVEVINPDTLEKIDEFEI